MASNKLLLLKSKTIPAEKQYYILLAAIPFLVFVCGIIILLHSPYLDMQFIQQDGQWIIESVDSGGPAGNHTDIAGSVLIAVNGFTLNEYDLIEDFDYIPDRSSLTHWWEAQKFFSSSVITGKPVRLLISAGNERRTVEVVPESLPLLELAGRAGMMYFLGLFSLLIGLIVVLKKREDLRARLFFYMVLSVGTIFVTFGSYTSRDMAFSITVFSVFRVLNVCAFAYFPVLFLHFFLVFPRMKKIAGNKWLIAFLYILPVIVTILYQPRISFLSMTMLFVGGLLGGIVSMIYSYVRAETVLERYQIRWVLMGMGIFTIVFLAVTFIPLLFHGQRLFGDRVPSLFFIFIPLSIAFAITKYHLMNIDTIFDYTIIYSCTLVVLAGFDLGIMSFLSNLKIFSGLGNESINMVLALWIAVVAYTPVRRSVAGGIKKLLKRTVYDTSAVIMTLNTRLLKAADIPGIMETASELISRTLHAKQVIPCMCRYNKEDGKRYACRERLSDFVISTACRIKNETEPRFLYLLCDEESDIPPEFAGGVVIPLYSVRGPLGCFILQNKITGGMYSKKDIQLLKSIGYQVSLAIESVLRKDEVFLKDREAQDERERISREIHDGIGSSFSNAIMMVDLLQKDAGTVPAAKKRLLYLKDILCEGLAELRDLIYAIEEDEYSVGELVFHLNAKARRALESEKITFEFTGGGIDSDISCSTLKRLNVIRIVQESLANVIKHSGATHVNMNIDQTGEMLEIKLTDNGRGFNSDSVSSGYGIRNIKKRCDEIEAECSIESQLGRGTKIVISVPLQRNQDVDGEGDF